jgi:Spy/CpxP family protein refolding chaperone
MIRKVLIASLLLCAVAFAQPSQGVPGMHGGPGFDGPHGTFGHHGPKPGGDLHGILPPGRWWKDAEIVKTIGLNDGQVQKIETIFQESRMKLVDVHASLQKEEIKLEPLLEADNPDESAVLGAIDRIAATRANLEKANAQMAFAIRRVLTPEQWKKLRDLRSARNHFPPPSRFGGPHAKFQHNGHSHMPPAPAEPPVPEAAPTPEADK